MALTLNSGDHDTIRLLTGVETTATDLTDAQIESDAILGVASTYVFLLVTARVDVGYIGDNLNMPVPDGDLPTNGETGLELTTPEERLAEYKRLYYSTVTRVRNLSVDNFIRDAMSMAQRDTFRRAVLYRAAGLAMSVIKPQVLVEDAEAVVSVRRSDKSWSEVQTELFAVVEELIDAVLDFYPSEGASDESPILFTYI